ncbi:MAG: hypothetical protein ACI9MC_000638, partial [Kiritimatiellia bacterium]
YMSNDFDEADTLLDSLDAMGADNNNLSRLRSNLDVVQGRSSGAESAMSRRVVAQAWSRGEEDRRAREEVLQDAEKELEAGNYDQAEQAYNRASTLSQKLAKVEQKESVEEKGKVKYSEDNAFRAKKEKAEHVKNQAFYQASSQAGPRRDRVASPVVASDSPDPDDRDVAEDVAEDVADASEFDSDVEAAFVSRNSLALLPVPERNVAMVVRQADVASRPVGNSPVRTVRSAEYAFGGDASRGAVAVVPGFASIATGDSLEPLQVSSTSMSIVVPVLGQTIRYQHLLLPADALVVVHVEARAPRSSIRSLL